MSAYRIKGMSPQLLVADLDRSVDFFTTKLGFSVEFRYDDFYVGIRKDDCSIHLKKGWSPAAGRVGRTDPDQPDVLFSVDGIEAIYYELSGNAIDIVQPLREMPYGSEFYVADPDGHVIAFVGS